MAYKKCAVPIAGNQVPNGPTDQGRSALTATAEFPEAVCEAKELTWAR